MRIGRSLVALLPLSLCSVFVLGQTSSTVPATLTLMDQTGAGIPHLQIRVIPAPEASAKTETDEAGKLTIALKPGGYALFARLAGFKPLATHFDVRATKEPQAIPFVLQNALYSGSVVVTETTSKSDLLLLTYPYHDPLGMSLAQIKNLPHISVTIHNPHTSADESYSGVRVADLLAPLGAPLGKELRGIAIASYLIATGADGYQAVLALGEVDPDFHPGEVLVADAMNGKPLDPHNGPLKLVVTEDKRPARSVRNLTTIELKTAQ